MFFSKKGQLNCLVPKKSQFILVSQSGDQYTYPPFGVSVGEHYLELQASTNIRSFLYP